MERSPVLGCGATAALLLLALTTASAAPQSPAPCPGAACVPAAPRQPTTARIYERKQAFVAAVRQLSLSLAGRFGDEGRRLRADVDAMESALSEWDQEIAALETALRSRRLDAEAYTALGSVQLDRYRVQDAVRAFNAAAQLEPKSADIQELLAMAHGLARQPAAAVRALGRAAALRPDDAAVRYEIARYAMESDAALRSTEVFTTFQRVAARQLASGAGSITFARPGLLRQTAGVAPIFPPASYLTAFAALMDGRFEDAIAECRRALASEPLLQPAGDGDLLAAGAGALRQGDVPGALRQLTAAVAAAPGSPEAHRILGTAYRLDDQWERSIEAYTNAIQLAPMDERARIGLADVLIDMERLDEAERALRDMVRAVPQGVLGHYRLGRLLQARGKYAEALTELESAARHAPLVGQDALHEMVALLYANQADFANAINALRRQVAVNPGNADAHRRLGDTYVRQGRTMEALAEFTVTLLVDPRNVLGFVGLAQLHLNSGNHAEAVRAARAAIALDPAQTQVHYVLATALTRLGQADEARRVLAEYQRLQAAGADASKRKFERDGLARQIAVAMTAGDHQTAVSLLRQLIALEPGVAAHQVTLGQALAARGQTLDAIQAYRAATEFDPADPNVHRYLAEAYIAAGQIDAGRLEAARYRELVEAAKRQRALRYGNP